MLSALEAFQNSHWKTQSTHLNFRITHPSKAFQHTCMLGFWFTCVIVSLNCFSSNGRHQKMCGIYLCQHQARGKGQGRQQNKLFFILYCYRQIKIILMNIWNKFRKVSNHLVQINEMKKPPLDSQGLPYKTPYMPTRWSWSLSLLGPDQMELPGDLAEASCQGLS